MRAAGQKIDATACRWDAATGSAFRRTATSGIEIDCSRPASALLQCDPPGFEPRDVDATALCKSPLVSFDAAVVRLVEATPASDVDVTWLRGATGDVVVRASRRFHAAATIAVAAAPQSFVRLTPANGSPITRVFQAIDAETPFAFNTDTPGGELFIRQPTVPVMPVRVTVTPQASGTPASCATAVCSLSGLPSATYRLTRVYDGGLSTAAIPALIEDGRSTDAWLPAESVGGLDVTIGGGLCGSVSTVNVSTSPPPTRRVASASIFNCRARLGGIRPGTYEVSAGGERRGDLIVKQAADVQSQMWTPVMLDAPPVIVTGYVTSDTLPVRHTGLQFTRIGSNEPAQSTETDGDGHYTIGLTEAGHYAVQSLAGSDADPWVRTADFWAGTNQFDAQIEAGTLTIVVPKPLPGGRAGRGGAATVTIHVDGPRWQKSLSKAVVSTPQSIITFELTGLAFGTYGVWAEADAGPSVRYETATLEATTDHLKSSAQIGLVNKTGPSYVPAPGSIDVFNPSRALTDVTASITTLGPTLPMTSRGHIESASGITPGAPLFLSKLPSLTCITYRRGPQAMTLSDQVAEVELRFPKLAPSLPADVSGRITNIPGATCAPYLTQFNLRRSVSDEFESIFVTLPMGGLTLEVGGQKFVVNVPGQAVTIR